MIKNRNNSEHYIWGDNCKGWRLLDDRDLSVIEEEMPPYTAEKFHFHKLSQQLFYVLSGTAIFEVNGEKFVVDKNEGFNIKPFLTHMILNNSPYAIKSRLSY